MFYLCGVFCIQVTIVCQRMIKEREEMLRSEYDKVLTTKLAGTWSGWLYFLV